MLFRSPRKPFIAIMGGAKVGDKIKVMENLLKKVDAMACDCSARTGIAVRASPMMRAHSSTGAPKNRKGEMSRRRA